MNRLSLKGRVVMAMLERISHGGLRLIGPDGRERLFGNFGGPHAGPSVEVEIRSWRVFDWAFSRGDIGFAEAYMEGHWSTSSLPELLHLLVTNRQSMERAIHGSKLSLFIDRLQHLLLRRNTRRQARRNIEAHYDLGNDFYKLWLDPTMTYSSALWDATGMWGQPVDLEDGQRRKMDRAIAQLGDLGPESRTLEIGCGWGGLALRRLTQPGAHLGITLSTEQKAWADELLAREGLAPRSEIRIEDYRETRGQFDGILSIEMIEAVGEQYWPAYFKTLYDRLKPGAKAVVQVIVIKDELFSHYRTSMDFIQKYIFPGGMLLCPTAIDEQAAAAQLEITDRFSFGQDYGRTLREWLLKFEANEDLVRTQGFGDRFVAMWRYYLAYCEAGFRVRDLDVLQVTYQRP